MSRANKHVMAIISYLALVPLVYFIPDLVAEFFTMNKLANVMVSVGIIVPIITYCVMPVASRLVTQLTNKKGSN